MNNTKNLLIYLFILFPQCFYSFSNDILPSMNTTIAHLETGLFLNYVGVYKPSDTIIHNSAIFPMTIETCHLLPSAAVLKIPACNIKQQRRRRKRVALAIIAVGVGLAHVGLTIRNTIQIANLQYQIDLVENTLSNFNQIINIHEAKLANIQSNQIKIIKELQLTQRAINSLIPILDSHSKILIKLNHDIALLHKYFQYSFLYLSINQILRNQLNLNFLAPNDLRKVVYDVIEQGNLTFNQHYGSISLVEMITRLLIRQEINFIPNSNKNGNNSTDIGHLIITNYFAVPQQQQETSFYVYKLVAVPFIYKNESLQLTGIPQYWAINPINNTTMEWYKPEESGCSLQLMTTCRDTPPIYSMTKDSCVSQILNRLPISNCHSKSNLNQPSLFIERLTEQFWIISSSKLMQCLKISKIEYHSTINEYHWNNNEQIILPPVALVEMTPGYTILCPGFSLVGHPNHTKTSSLTILYNNTKLSSNNTPIIDVYQYLMENTTWYKKNWSEISIETLLHDVNQSWQTPINEIVTPIHNWSWIIILISLIILLLIFIYKFYINQLSYRYDQLNL